MRIIGAGLAGLLAANLLRHKSPIVLEKQDALPNNHSAVLRFRSSIVSDVLGIPFKKVNVIKDTLPWRNSVADALAYAEKNTSVLRSDRSIPTQMISAERYIAPPDLISQLSENIDITYNAQFNSSGVGLWTCDGPIISTIPMPILMKILEYPEAQSFPSVQGVNIRGTIADCDAYVSLYVPDPFYSFSRISLTGNEIIVELPTVNVDNPSELIYTAAAMLGIDARRVFDIRAHKQTYAKILPIDEGERTRFIMWATDKYNIYSLGRYACWRPSTLLDDLVKDIRMIERWINSGTYAMRKHR